MSITAELERMAKTRGRPTTNRDDVSVKLERALAGKAKILAAHKGSTVAEVISDLLRAPLDRAYAVMIRELDKGAEK